jgi:hypothetical protein
MGSGWIEAYNIYFTTFDSEQVVRSRAAGDLLNALAHRVVGKARCLTGDRRLRQVVAHVEGVARRRPHRAQVAARIVGVWRIPGVATDGYSRSSHLIERVVAVVDTNVTIIL